MGTIQIALDVHNERIDAEPPSDFGRFTTNEKVVRLPNPLVA
jgi:hypothetical protein